MTNVVHYCIIIIVLVQKYIIFADKITKTYYNAKENCIFIFTFSVICNAQTPNTCTVKSGAKLTPNAENMVAIGARFPDLEVKTLGGNKLALPDAVQGKMTLISVSFTDPAQEKLDSWSNDLFKKYADNATIDYLETILISGKNKAFSGFINKGMKKAVAKSMHDKVSVYFGDLKPYYEHFGVSDKDDAYLFLLDKNGNVLFESSGMATSEKLAVLYSLVEEQMKNTLSATPKTSTKDTLIYVMDPICPWCFAYSKTISDIQTQYGDKYFIKVLPGGLAIGDMAGTVKSMKSHLTEGNKYVEKATGVKMGEAFKKNIVGNDSYEINSEKPCMAINAVSKLAPEQALNFTNDLEKAFYIDGLSLNDNETYLQLVKKYNVEAKDFIALLNDETLKTLTYDGFKQSEKLGATGFPTLFLKSNNKISIINAGYLAEEKVLKKLKTIN